MFNSSILACCMYKRFRRLFRYKNDKSHFHHIYVTCMSETELKKCFLYNQHWPQKHRDMSLSWNTPFMFTTLISSIHVAFLILQDVLWLNKTTLFPAQCAYLVCADESKTTISPGLVLSYTKNLTAVLKITFSIR